MPTKSSVNTNFARAVSDPLNAPLKNEQDGTEPLTDLRGVLYVNTSASPPPPVILTPYVSKRFYSSAGFKVQDIMEVYLGAMDLLTFYGFKNNTGALRYIQIFSGPSLPLNGAIPIISIPLVGTNTVFSVDNPIIGVNTYMFIGGGISYALSTTGNFLTLALTGNVWVNAMIGKI